MSVFKNQYTRALTVIPSDTVDIPFPNKIIDGTFEQILPDKLVDVDANFIELGVKTGDIIYLTSDTPYQRTAVYVVAVVNETTIQIEPGLNISTYTYILYSASSQSTIGNQGCGLYVYQTNGSNPIPITVVTIGGDEVTFDITEPIVLPVQVKRVKKSVGFGDFQGVAIALW